MSLKQQALARNHDDSHAAIHRVYPHQDNCIADHELQSALVQLALSKHSDHPTDALTADRNAHWGLLRSALRGHREAAYQLGLYYAQYGESRRKEAEKWLHQAAHQDHPHAEQALSRLRP